ncbi:hypothetical protein NL533_31285, partial [Klebsiella pneumoniae]|nr:hypothetical protein [Klebsiella pneumoniae]
PHYHLFLGAFRPKKVNLDFCYIVSVASSFPLPFRCVGHRRRMCGLCSIQVHRPSVRQLWAVKVAECHQDAL